MKAVRTSFARHRVRCRLAHPLARSSSFYRQLGETARHEDAPLAVATQITDFCIKIPFQVSANVIGRASIRGTVDIRWAEGAAQRIDAPEVNPCCRPGNLD
jgi:hypothetical protein